jgi:multicomponent K+:H+ antiporter subunit E
MKLRFPLLWLALTAMWLLLAGTPTVAQTLVGSVVALLGVAGFARLQQDPLHLRRPVAAIALAAIVLHDIVRSNIAVTSIVLRPGTRGRRAGFVRIPLRTRQPATLAALACIITATPGTSWAGYDSDANVFTMHVLDLVDEPSIVLTIQQRYERRLMEILE